MTKILICCALCLACGSSAKQTAPMEGGAAGMGGGAAGAGGGDAAAGSGGADAAADVNGTCVRVSLVVQQPAPPDILILQDQSASLNDDINDQPCDGGCGESSKWSLLTSAIESLVMATDGTVNWGLKLFANDNMCGVIDGAAVQVGPFNYGAIQYALGIIEPSGSAPIEMAMNSAIAYLQELNDSSPKYILLATGGQPNCTPGGDPTIDDSSGAETAVTNAVAAGFPTFVVGATSGANAVSTATLNQLALNGNEPQTAAATSYYGLSDIAAVTAAVIPMFITTAGCTVQLTGRPDGGAVSISVTTENGTVEVPEDSSDGWSYDATGESAIFNGTACSQLMDGTDTSVVLSYGCGT